MTTKVVIFDLDGTLVEFRLDYEAERTEVTQWLIKQGIQASAVSMEEGTFGALKKAEAYLRAIGKKESEVKRIKEGVLAVADHHEMEAAKTTNLFPGTLEALKTLREMGLKLALFTICGEKVTRYVFRRFGIERFFDVIITRDSVAAIKPDPAHLRAALEALEVEPLEAMVVGDSRLDMRCASELGILAVGVVTGISTPEELTAAGASYLASSTAQIPRLVQHLNRKTEISDSNTDC